jgi:TPR repeat protein
MSKINVLFLAADPRSAGPDGRSPRLMLDDNVREIRERVNAAEHGDSLELVERWAVRTKDLLHALNQVRPQVVHFSGHGGDHGLVLVGSDGRTPHPVDADALEGVFRACKGNIRLVVLSACHSYPQAKAIAEVVGCAVGTRNPISDEAAITFDAAFYSAIAFGHSVQTAYDQARAQLKLDHVADHECPELIHRPDVDPSSLMLMPPRVQEAPPRSTSRLRHVVQAGALVVGLGGAVYAADQLGAETPTEVVCARARSVLPDQNAPDAGMPARGLMNGGAATGSPGGGSLRAAKDLYAAGHYDAAFPLFKEAALAGNMEAAGFVGVAYMRGQGTPPNPDSTVVWLNRAAEARDARGMTAKGEAYQLGFGFRNSAARARHWYRAAADEKSYGPAMRSLGTMYRDGIGGPPRPDSALEWYEKSAKAGVVDAMADAGWIYEQGLGVPADAEAAQCWYRGGAQAGSAAAMVALGKLHERRQEYDRAREQYEKAARVGSAEAMNNLGVLYQNGLGVTADRGKAIELYRRAASAGSAVARSNLDTLGGE